MPRPPGYGQTSGTVTRVVTEGFGVEAGRADGDGIRAARLLVPGGRRGRATGLDGHVAAWCDALCMAAGLPPLGVSALRPPSRRRQP